MAKKYTIPCSTKNAYLASGSTNNNLPLQSNPTVYYAGVNRDKHFATHCLFSGLSNISKSVVTSVTLHIQRLVGGTDITYAVNLDWSVLAETAPETLQIWNTIFTTNKTEWQWPYNEDATGGEYTEITIPVAMFDQLKAYGWCLTGSNDNYRYISVGDVYLTVITNEVDTYTVSYNKGANGTGTNTTATKTHGVALTLKGAIFTRTGYTQTGWSTSDGGSKVYDLNGSYTADKAVTLYPFWTAKTYTVTFDANGGTVSPTTQTVTYGSAYGTLPTPTRTGGTFGGWLLNEKLVTAATVCSTANNHTLIAYWSSITCLYVKSADGSMKPGWVFRKKSDGTIATAAVYQKNADGTITS